METRGGWDRVAFLGAQVSSPAMLWRMTLVKTVAPHLAQRTLGNAEGRREEDLRFLRVSALPMLKMGLETPA